MSAVRVIHDAASLRTARSSVRVVVMTMGALHAGHADLIRRARILAGGGGTVIVTVFVNPTQFGAGEDFDRYPRTLDEDVAIATDAGADIVFAPDVREVYGPSGAPGPQAVSIDPGPRGDILEGAARPGHFRGVLTVVAKLLALTGADVSIFGEKDYQQFVLVRSMVADLSLPVEIVPGETVREDDGLARSSRNRFLTPDERRAAASLSAALRTVSERLSADGDVPAALAAGREALDSTVDLDYLVVTDLDLGPAPASGPARALIAARLGTTRLIDNVSVTVGA